MDIYHFLAAHTSDLSLLGTNIFLNALGLVVLGFLLHKCFAHERQITTLINEVKNINTFLNGKRRKKK
jgi:hypothetical protein